MTNEELEMILSMGSDEEALAEILRQQGRQEDRIDSTRNRAPGIQAGNAYVANIAQPIADMFIRGRAGKKAKELGSRADEMRSMRDRKMADFFRGLQGQQPGGPPLPVTSGGPDPSKAVSVPGPQGGVPMPPPVPPIPPPSPQVPRPAPQGAPAPKPQMSMKPAPMTFAAQPPDPMQLIELLRQNPDNALLQQVLGSNR